MAHMEVHSCHKTCQPRLKKMIFVSFLQSNTKRRALLHPIPDDVNSLITLLKEEMFCLFSKELGNILQQDEERIVQIYSWNGVIIKRRPKKDFDRSKFQKCCNRTILTHMCSLCNAHYLRNSTLHPRWGFRQVLYQRSTWRIWIFCNITFRHVLIT